MKSIASFVVLVGALFLVAPGSAGVKLRGIDTSSYPTVRLNLVTPSASQRPPSLRENGLRIDGLVAENLGREKSVVLAIDRSRSMIGAPIRNAAAAARSFVARKPPSDRISIVTFGSRAVQLTRFSSATIDADIALRTLGVDGRQGTALYDGIVVAAQAIAASGLEGRVIIVLTDGRDVSSAASKTSAIQAARAAGAAVYPIAIEGEQFSPAPLQEIARATGGRYYGAPSSGALAQIYGAIARELRRTWRLEYVTAARPGERLELRGSVRGRGASSTRVTMPGAGVGTSAGSESSRSLLAAFASSRGGDLLLALAVGALVLLAFRAFSASRRASRLRARVQPYAMPAPEAEKRKSARDRLAAASGLFKATEGAFGNLRLWRFLQRSLERADLPLRTVELVYVMLGASFVLALVLAIAGSPAPLILFGFLLGALIPYGFVRFKGRKRLRAFEDQLPDLLMTMAASLKAGHSFRQGIQTAADEGQEPASKELGRVLSQSRLGRPLDDALAEVAERLGSKNFKFVVSAVTIQRQVGGSLAGLFDMVADTVRSRQQFTQKIKALTSMGRMSAYVLIALPIVMALGLTAMNPTYMAPLYETPTGQKLIVFGLVMMAFGSLIIKKIVSFKG